MTYNLILAGVGGQGILTIAHLISRAAMNRGLHVKQSEVHGMSQRGGAVQSHVRFSAGEVYSDLISLGEANMVLSVEPLESLRYVEYLRSDGVIVTSSAPVINIPNYPPIEEVLERVATFGDHVIVNAPQLARQAGSARAENMVMLGAAAVVLDLPDLDWKSIIAEAFQAKGRRIVDVNRRAFELGRRAAELYRSAVRVGAPAKRVRARLDALSAEQILRFEQLDGAAAVEPPAGALTAAEAAAVDQIFSRSVAENRVQLFEHEVYTIVEVVGGLPAPRHQFIPAGEHVSDEDLGRFPGERVVLKVASQDIVHKSDAGGVVFTARSAETINRELDRLTATAASNHTPLAGVLIVEYIEHAHRALGGELFVGIRATREFGPVIAAGLGGVDTEFLAERLQRGMAVAKAPIAGLTPEAFFRLFERTAAYELVSGRVRGHYRAVSDYELLRCFAAFIAIAERFCRRDENGLGLAELEVNPFAFVKQRMVPLDGRGRLDALPTAAALRSAARVNHLLEPRSVAVVGVSSKRANFGRIILNNIQECGFPTEHLYVVKPDEKIIDGVRCVPTVADLPAPVDLLVAAVGAEHAPKLVDEILTARIHGSPCCSSVILIPGGMGEKEGTAHIHAELQEMIADARCEFADTPVFLGGNCMGVRSRPGRYDTFFIPKHKLDPRRDVPPRRVALVSQSGAFMITRMSNLEFLDPAIAVSLGNQVDLTVSDFIFAIAHRPDIDCIGVYMEGFNDLDGMEFLRAVEQATAAGKVVVFYKAGRTAAGRTAAQGHTASLAGDYDVCDAAVAGAGAIVTETFKEFEQLIELATDLHGKKIGGRRLGAVSNAGYETVGMADATRGARYRLEMPALSAASRERLDAALARHGLENLVNARNPLDLTPMADDEAYEESIRVMLESETIDAVIVGCVPMTPQLLTLPGEATRSAEINRHVEVPGLGEIEKPGSIAKRIPALFAEYDKPIVFVVDCAAPYDALARAVREAGVPVFRSADQAVRSLGRYLCHRAASSDGDSDTAQCQSSRGAMALTSH